MRHYKDKDDKRITRGKKLEQKVAESLNLFFDSIDEDFKIKANLRPTAAQLTGYDPTFSDDPGDYIFDLTVNDWSASITTDIKFREKSGAYIALKAKDIDKALNKNWIVICAMRLKDSDGYSFAFLTSSELNWIKDHIIPEDFAGYDYKSSYLVFYQNIAKLVHWINNKTKNEIIYELDRLVHMYGKECIIGW